MLREYFSATSNAPPSNSRHGGSKLNHQEAAASVAKGM